MPRQHEVVAVGRGKKAATEKALTDAYHLVQKPELFDGLRRTYAPLDPVAGEQLPAEVKNASHRLANVVSRVANRVAELMDVVLTMDAGNQVARADVMVPDGPTVRDVPVPTLLFLEKQLENLKAFVEALPTPDASEVWIWDPNQGLLATPPTQTHRTKKTQKPVTLSDATDRHPAQVQLVSDDVLVGYWTSIRYTSRVPADVKDRILTRLSRLRDAVRTARERANAAEVEWRQMGVDLTGYLFGDFIR